MIRLFGSKGVSVPAISLLVLVGAVMYFYLAGETGRASTQHLPYVVMPQIDTPGHVGTGDQKAMHRPMLHPVGITRTPLTLGDAPFAQSLEGTEIDGLLRTDQDGALVLDINVKDFFDYFLNTQGEVGEQVVLDEIETIIKSTLPQNAAHSALQLLDDYLNYKKAAMVIYETPIGQTQGQPQDLYLETLADTLQAMKALRRSFMSPDAVDAFFELEEAYGDFTIEAMRIYMDPNLDEETKSRLVSYHRNQLPEVIHKTENRIISDEGKYTKTMHLATSEKSDESLSTTLKALGHGDIHINNILKFRQQQDGFLARYSAYRKARDKYVEYGATANEIRLLQYQYFNSESELSQARVKDLDVHYVP